MPFTEWSGATGPPPLTTHYFFCHLSCHLSSYFLKYSVLSRARAQERWQRCHLSCHLSSYSLLFKILCIITRAHKKDDNVGIYHVISLHIHYFLKYSVLSRAHKKDDNDIVVSSISLLFKILCIISCPPKRRSTTGSRHLSSLFKLLCIKYYQHGFNRGTKVNYQYSTILYKNKTCPPEESKWTTRSSCASALNDRNRTRDQRRGRARVSWWMNLFWGDPVHVLPDGDKRMMHTGIVSNTSYTSGNSALSFFRLLQILTGFSWHIS